MKGKMLWLAMGLASLLGLVTGALAAEAPFHEAELIFPPGEAHGHVHASCVVELPDGQLLAVWYENGPNLPPPYYSKGRQDQDRADNVRIGGCRKLPGKTQWEEPFVMSETFGVSDNNPCMVIDRDKRLWLFHPTLLGVPKNPWGSAIVQFKVSSDYLGEGPPAWERERVLVCQATRIETALNNMAKRCGGDLEYLQEALGWFCATETLDEAFEKLEDPLMRRLGWMPRAHPIIRSDGTLILPVANENFGVSAMAMTKDVGDTWSISEAVPEAGVIQPALVELPNGKILAYFRNKDRPHRIKRSESTDGGLTWTVPVDTDRPHNSSGLEIMRLANGHLALVYNDRAEPAPDTGAERDRLAISISVDEGNTWAYTRYIENEPGGNFSYPSIIQGKDGMLHVTYSYNVKSIKHARFNEAWVLEGGAATTGQ